MKSLHQTNTVAFGREVRSAGPLRAPRSQDLAAADCTREGSP